MEVIKMIDKDRLSDGLYLLTKGVRDCLEMSIVGTPKEINDQLCDIESLATRGDYHVLAFKINDKELESEGREYHMVFVCKYQYQRILLTKLFNDIKPHSFIYEYIMGTLLGYSAASMEEFLMTHSIDHIIGKECYNPDEETDTSSAETTEKETSSNTPTPVSFNNDLRNLLDKFKTCPSEHDHNLKLTKEFADNYWGKFDSNSPRDKLIRNLATVLFSLETNAGKSEIISNMLEKFYSANSKEQADIEKPLTNFDSNAYHLLNIISQANTNDSDNILLIQKFIKQKPKRDDDHQKRLITNIANVLNSYHPMSDSRKVYYVTRLLEVYFGLPYYDDSTFKSDLKEIYYFFKNNKPKDCISKAKDLVNKYHRSLKDEKNKGMLTSIISNIDSEEAITIKRTRIMIDIEEFLRGDPKVVLEDRRKYVEAVKKLKDTISSLTPSSDFFDIINVFLRIDAPCRHEKIFKNKMIATMHNPSLTKLGKLIHINLCISNYLDYVNKNGY